MAEAAFRQMIATFIRQTRPQTFRYGKPPRYPQRSLVTAAAVPDQPQWQTHSIPSAEPETVPPKSRLHKLRNESEPRSFSSFLTDNYAREHSYLRISLTERCNLRCLYCMPEEGIQLSPPDHILTTPEIVYLSSMFVDQGVNKIRLTGGEPTVRKDILELMRRIGDLRSNGLKELCLTTNGISLHRKLDSMVDSGLTGVNLSLDTLDPFQFTIMTRRNGHEAVMKSIKRILDMNKHGAGIKLKINCVVMRGLNDKEIIPFVELGKDKDLEVRFIEYMPFDGNKWSQKKMLGFQEMLALIKQKYPDVYKVQDHINDTSKTYKVPGFVGRIGFITSMTHNFCGTCNRLRITSDGNLKVCLFGNSEVSLRDILRQSNGGKPIDDEAMEAIEQIESDRRQAISGSTGVLGVSEREAKLLEVIGAAVKRKKEKHAGMGELENMKNRPMILIDNTSCASTNQTSYQSQSSLRISSPLLAARTNTSFTRSIPVHLLSYNLQPSIFQQQRYRSTFLLRRTYITRKRMKRYVWTQPTHRWIDPGPSQTVSSRENLERTLRVKRSVNQTARAIVARARFGTTPSRVQETDPSRKKVSLSHLTSSGAAHMINIGHKKETHRSATAVAYLLFSSPVTYSALTDATLEKGDAIAVARIAAIHAAKKTADIIPLAHPGLGITAINVEVEPFPAYSKPIVRKIVPNNNNNSTKEQDTNPDPTPTTTNIPPLEIHHLKSNHGGVCVQATVECYGKTGVEMEALTAANAGVLTMYDMLKGIDKSMLITGSRVLEKRGGKSGSWRWSREHSRVVKFNGPTTAPVPPPPPPPPAEDNRITSNPPSNPATIETTDPELETESDPNSVLQAEWHNLSTSFSTDPPPPSPGPQSRAGNDHPKPHPDFTPLREKLSGSANEKVDAAAFRAARIERFEEWRKSH